MSPNPKLDAFDSTMSNALEWGMLMHGRCLTFCLISLTKLVWFSVHADAFFLSLLYIQKWFSNIWNNKKKHNLNIL